MVIIDIGKLPVLFYSQAKNQVFRPAGATRCTDSGQTLQYRRAPGSAWLGKISRQSVQTDGHNELYQPAKFGEDRTTRAGCRCENVVFFLSRSESGAPCVRGVHSSNTHCAAIYRPISTRFGSFFRKGLRFQKRNTVLTFVARWRHNFR